jgi:hypothetical protein
MKEIKLTQGYVTLVDDDDFEYLNQFKWHVAIVRNKYIYAIKVIKKDGKYKRIKLTNFLLNPPDGYVVDHKDRNTLNNTRENLRICLPKENGRNISKTLKNTTSIYKGVVYHKGNKSWEARIKIDGKRIYLGNFKNEEDAAMAYDKKAIELHKEFASLNFC